MMLMLQYGKFMGMLLFEIEIPLLGPQIILIGTGLIGLCLAYFRWYLAIPTLALLALLIVFFLSELIEPDYAVIQRQDPTYIPLMYLGMFISVILPFVGVILNFRRAPRV